MNINVLQLTIEDFYQKLDRITDNYKSYSIQITDYKYSKCAHDGLIYEFSFSYEHLLDSFHNGLYESTRVRSKIRYYGKQERSDFYTGWNAIRAIAIHEYVHMLLPNDAHNGRFIELYNSLLMVSYDIKNVYQTLNNHLELLS